MAAATSLFSDWGVTTCNVRTLAAIYRSMGDTHGIGIDSKDVLIECRVNPNDIAHLVVYLQFKGCHRRIEMHTVEVLHEQNLTVTLPSVARL